MQKTISELPPMPQRARAVILEMCETRGVHPLQIVNACRKQRVYRARRDIAVKLRSMNYSMIRIGQMLNHDHTTIVFYCGRLAKKPAPMKWSPPKVRHLRFLRPPKPTPAPKFSRRRYAGFDPSEIQIIYHRH